MSRPDLRKYSVTTFDPGARLVLTHGLRVRPRSNAFLATRPAPIMTLGFDVFVQLVIAAITTEPWSSSNVSPSGAVTLTQLLFRRVSVTVAGGGERSSACGCDGCCSDVGSLAGNVSATALS